MSVAVSSNIQEEYEDDFEKDLDWLISEESKNEEQDEDDIESQIDHELKEEELEKEQEEEQSKSATDDDGDNERWPMPMDPLKDLLDVSADSKHEQDDEEVNEEKKSIQQKIEQANRQLQDEEAPDETRRRRLQFKDTLVDLVVPASDLEDSPGDVSEHMLKLKISSQEESDGHREGAREGRVLVEKDGKFDLVSLKEVESLLPPLPETQREPVKSPSPSTKLCLSSTAEPRYAPRPPERPRKEQLNKQQQRREKLAREEEERRREEEEQKRQENEMAFRSWLMKKRQQVREERRVQRAQEIERMNGKKECCDADEAFNLWLQRKKQQQLKEQQLEEMKRLEMESSSYMHQPEESAKAFRLWLRRKRMEKRQEQQAARERSRRLLMEERRARRMNDLCYPVDEIQSLRFNQPYSYCF
ncbi:coiled-coil domain-containing protein 181 isoform 2-T2 [Clarias gariepinus]|uniref:coiled-coil domain-containing protein 181 isoform X2 n=1 Tax=Clarias gariepinus TaxID=13013 RepID=UPI00234DBBD7|nr:coiled-coil domain-containing protein 181 isoform X2 [Clarias gariepinus]